MYVKSVHSLATTYAQLVLQTLVWTSIFYWFQKLKFDLFYIKLVWIIQSRLTFESVFLSIDVADQSPHKTYTTFDLIKNGSFLWYSCPKRFGRFMTSNQLDTSWSWKLILPPSKWKFRLFLASSRKKEPLSWFEWPLRKSKVYFRKVPSFLETLRGLSLLYEVLFWSETISKETLDKIIK